MDERTTGIILRTRPLTETSLIVHWLTPDLGRLATVAKGARRLKSPFAGKLDIFFGADFSFQRSRRSDLHALREVSVRNFNPALRTELGYLRQAAYFTRLLEQTTETETPLPAFYQMFVDALSCLPTRPPQMLIVHAFEIKLLHELGVAPDLAKCALTASTKSALKRIAEADWPSLMELTPNREQNAELSRFLRGLLASHLGKIPSGRPNGETAWQAG